MPHKEACPPLLQGPQVPSWHLWAFDRSEWVCVFEQYFRCCTLHSIQAQQYTTKQYIQKQCRTSDFNWRKLMTSWRHILYKMLRLVKMQTVAAPTKVAMASSRCMSWGCSGRSGGCARRAPPIWAATAPICERALPPATRLHNWYISIWGLGCSQDGFGENRVK